MTAQVIPFPPLYRIVCFDGEFDWEVPQTQTRDAKEADQWLEEYRQRFSESGFMFWIEAR